MEEISSLDSFHTDGADSTARPESTEPAAKQDETSTENLVEKLPTPVEETPNASNTTEDAEATKDSAKEEDFEQISDGTFEVDENSQATSTGPPLEEEGGGTQEKPPEEGAIKDNDDSGKLKNSEAEKETTKPAEQEGDIAGNAVGEESADFEEVDANISANAHAADESDMLGESDMTLPTDEQEQEEEVEVEAGEKCVMEVDHEEEDEEYHETENTQADVEMASVSNSPAAAEKALNKSNDESMEAIDEEIEAGEVDEPEAEVDEPEAEVDEPEAEVDEPEGDEDALSSKDVVDAEEEHLEEHLNNDNEFEEIEQNAAIADENECGEKDKDSVQDTDNNVANDDDDADAEKDKDGMDADVDADADISVIEHLEDDDVEPEDEPVENVQEPEESDVCLIPDDTETEVTDAEKEQAILARENAEKEDADAEAVAEAEKEIEAATNTAKDNETAEVVAESANDEENADADAQANKQAGAEAAAASSAEATPVVDVNDAAELPDPDEPLLEELHPSSTSGDTTEVASKIIIGWIVASVHKCQQCGEEKECGFRYKIPESSELEYVCEQACCDAILSANPGKYFIRRKKFLVEELSNESRSAAEKSNETATEDSGEGETTSSAANSHYCLQCKEIKVSKYFFKQDDEFYYVCNDDCFNLLSAEEPDKFKLKRHSIRVRNIGATTISAEATPSLKKSSTSGSASTDSRVTSYHARTAAEAETARLERVASFTRRCADCFADIATVGDKNLLWETLDFCNEICLGKYQRTIGASCQTCSGDVPHQALGKYCVRFGFDIRQFCCAACLNEFKKGLKTCSCCQKDISSGTEGFLAPVGDKEQFKDFCSQTCMRRYDSMCNPKKKLRQDYCAVCNNDKPVRVEIVLDDKEHSFCSNPCFSAFKFVSNIVADQCGMCCKYFERKGAEAFTIYTERRAKVFCTRICLNVYIIVNRRIVSCQWCKVKKYNFDMIYKQQDAQEILMCSLNCLTLYGVSINAFSRTVAKCDNCNNSATPQYHLTMSDASMRNFCTYQCVMQFQSQFARTPLTLENEPGTAQSSATGTASQKSSTGKNSAPFPTGLPKRVKLKTAQQQTAAVQIKLPMKPAIKPIPKSGATKNIATKNIVAKNIVAKHISAKNIAINKKAPASTLPVISTVSSLASGETETMIGSVTVRRSRGRGRKMDSPTPPPLPLSVQNAAPSGRGRPRKTIDYARSPSPVSLSPPRILNKRSTATTSTSPAVAAPPSKGAEKVSVQTETKIIAVPPYPPTVRNVQTSCKPQTVTVGFQCEPKTATIGTQTDKDYSNKVLIPVPVPIYIPQPMYMYSAPFPVPVPIPLPIPVPIFIPTTRNSSQGILKEIKKIQDKMPADPFEAELLMMAEMVAEEKRESDSDSDEEVKPDPAVVAAMQYGSSNNVQQQQQHQQVEHVAAANNSYGEDVLQMALKMATGEYDQPSTVDLESAMTANTITNPPPGMVGHDDSMSHMSGHHMQQEHHMMEPQRGGRGRKRGAMAAAAVSPRNNRSPVKRQRLQELETSPQPVTTPQPMQPVEKPDANMCLKYTFGVNAWKQWVMTKNADIEKSSIRRRTFKNELLQMTADELNYSLCLFVKEVRKPNGTEYAPDTIYYLVLGIQQYLFENGRIDNIFTDPYYERFTDCLDEVARKFSVLYNDSQYIVTRVEEEHLWECKQLGAHSPHVLLSTLMFFNTKHFNLTTVEEHMQLSFSHIMKHWKRSAQNAKTPSTRNVLLRFYPPQAGLDANPRKKRVYEQQENEENPLRCPVRLYEFYLSKCPESVKTRNDVFYLQPERSCVPDSPVWYSTQALSQDALQKMLHRVKMVKEINIALLTS